jgi:Uma2 family endonuclease
MSTIAGASQPLAEVALLPTPAEPLWRLNLSQFHEMVQKGIISEDDPVEFLEGLLVEKMTISPAHRRATHRVQAALRSTIPQTHYVGSPSPVTLFASEPEPDVVVVRGSDDDYADRHPGPADVALVVEVADSSLRRDRGFKKVIYAKAGIAVYWIVNLADRQIEVYSEPHGTKDAANFRAHKDYAETELVPLVIDGQTVATIAANHLLP